MLFPLLDSVDDASLCGPIQYELKSPDQTFDTAMLMSDSTGQLQAYFLDPLLENIVTLVKEAPTDNSAPLEVEIWTEDYQAATPHDLSFAS